MRGTGHRIWVRRGRATVGTGARTRSYNKPSFIAAVPFVPYWPILYGPAARCKPKIMIWRRLVLRFCIRPIDGAFELLAIMDIRARSISFATRPRRPDGPPDHERAGETFSPSPLSDSQTSAGKPTVAFGLT